MPLTKIQEYSNLREQGDSTIIQRISLLVEQERILREQITDLEAHLDFILQKSIITMKVYKKLGILNPSFLFMVFHTENFDIFYYSWIFGACEWLALVGYKVDVISFPLFLKRW